MKLIDVKNFSFNYPGQPPLIQEVSFGIESGSFNLLLGLNGSGKTTLIQHLTPTFIKHGKHQGDVLFHGTPLEDSPQEKIGYVMQHPDHQIVTDKVWHELAFGLENLGLSSAEIRQRVAEIVNFFGMNQWFEQDIATLSGGQKQLLNLASTVIMNPEFLILDEPTAQLDPIATDNFIQMLHKLNHELGITILITEHDISRILPFTDKIMVLEEGRLIIDAPLHEAITEIFAQAPYLNEILPAAAQLSHEWSKDTYPLPLSVSEGKTWLAQQAKVHNSTKTPSIFEQENNKISQDTKSTPLIEAKHLWFGYETDADTIRDLSLTINQGETIMLLGANGSGKSTLMKLLLGQAFAYRGKLLLSGHALKTKQQVRDYQTKIGYLPQDPTTLFLKDTVLDDLLNGAKDEQTKQTVLAGLDSFSLGSLVNNNPFDLSGGQQQLLGLLKVLLRKPQILFVDEPTKGLDEKAKQLVTNIFASLHDQGVTIVMITHDIDFAAKNATRVGLFFNGDVTSCMERHAFFATNNFYTTEASRISRDYFSNAITVDEVLTCLKQK